MNLSHIFPTPRHFVEIYTLIL